MLDMECEDTLVLSSDLIESLRLIVSGTSDDDIVKGWESIRELEESGRLESSVNLDDALLIMRRILRGCVLNVHQVPKLMAYFAKYVKKKNVNKSDDRSFIVNDYIEFVEMATSNDIKLLMSMAKVLEEYPVYRSSASSTVKACCAIVASLGSIPMPKAPQAIQEFHGSAASIQVSLKMIGKTTDGLGNDFVKACLEVVYRTISDDRRKTTPGPGLAAILELVEPIMIGPVVKWIMAEPRGDDQLETALKVLCTWLPSLGRIENVCMWINKFIIALEMDKKYDILMNVADSCLRNILICMILPISSEVATPLAITFLTRLPTPNVFHKVINQILLNFTWLSSQKTKLSQECLQNLVDVTKALIERFPDYEINASLELAITRNKLSPNLANVATFKVEPVWSDEYETITSCEIPVLPISDHGKVGLTNLGNTCYMNSVLQALAMTRQFSQEVMSYKPTLIGNQESEKTAWVASAEEAASIMPKLQNLFALLLYSRRQSLSPTEILAASRPEYFTPGQQQDSSEFLCHLLDVLYEQEKSQLIRCTPVTEAGVGTSGKGKRSSDVTTAGRGVIKRWTTEEDLSEGISLERKTSQSLGDFPQASEDEEQLGQTQPGEVLSDCHSDSTDSGIQSVDGGGGNGSSDESAASETIIVHRVFGGESEITYQCAQCDTSSHNTDIFRDLQLCFPQEIADTQDVSVQDLMNYYLTPEKLTGDNKYRCDKCTKLCDAQRIIKILRAPIHLILTLKHFHYDPETRLRTKLRHKVTYNETIQLPVSSSSPQSSSSSSSSPIPETYRLYAAVVHSGYSMDYGHYFTYARDSKQNWYKFNDSYVSRSSLEDFNGLEPPDTPYILFYEKISANESSTGNTEEEHTKPDLTTLSKHIQELIERDTRSYEEELRHHLEKKRSKRTSPSGPLVSPSLRRHDNSDDENPPPSSCRGPIDMPTNRFLC